MMVSLHAISLDLLTHVNKYLKRKVILLLLISFTSALQPAVYVVALLPAVQVRVYNAAAQLTGSHLFAGPPEIRM